MNTKRLTSFVLTLALLASAATAGYALLFRPDTTQGQPSLDPDTARALTPTPAPPAPEHASIESANAAAAQSNPVVGRLIAAVARGDLDEVLALYREESRPCTPPDARVGNTPRCEDLGLNPGDLVRVYPVDIGQIAYAGEKYMRDEVGERLTNGKPRLAVLARSQAGEVHVSFAVDVSPSGVDSLNFIVAPGPDGGIVSYQGGVPTYNSSTAFETKNDWIRP